MIGVEIIEGNLWLGKVVYFFFGWGFIGGCMLVEGFWEVVISEVCFSVVYGFCSMVRWM